MKQDIYIESLSDYQGSIGYLIDELIHLQEIYGKDTIITVDAGHNNVSFVINPYLGKQ